MVGTVLLGCLPATQAALASPAAPALRTEGISFRADDGVVLHASVGSFGALSRRPLIVEDGPYADPVSSLAWAGPDYNYVELQWRGTGLSGGSLDSTGTRDQQDLAEFLGWACTQPWSDGNIGLYGFSASAIVVYNAMHLPLPCVRTAALMAGTFDLYRDLLYMGGVPNTAAGLVVLAGIGEPWLEDAPTRLQDEPSTVAASLLGGLDTSQVLLHPTEDAYWDQRLYSGDASHIPVLADTSFYDVEERGPFLAYQATRRYGSHLIVYGAHDGFPAGTGGPFPEFVRWFDHYLRGVDNGVTADPPVSLDLSNGSREQFLAGNFTRLSGSTWPLPGTEWTRLYLSAARSGTARSLNDGTLSVRPGGPGALQAYPFVPSDSFATDPHETATVDPDGMDQAAKVAPALTQMALAEPDALTYTTPPLAAPLDVVGPASLDVFASTTSPRSDLVAVLADVWPDGAAYPVAAGELNMDFPKVVVSRSVLDPQGDIVDPYNDFTSSDPPLPGTPREYHVELIPIGNHFAAGHRLRLYLVGTSVARGPEVPGVNTVSLAGVTPSRLIMPSVAGGFDFAP